MRKLIVGLLAGLVLGGAATAGAAVSEYWHRNSIGCTLSQGGVACKPDGLNRRVVLIRRQSVVVGVGDRTVVVNNNTGHTIVGDYGDVTWTG